MGRIKTIIKSPLFILYWIVASELIGFGMIIPVLPQITTRFSVSGLEIGVLLASYSLMQFFAAPVLGSWSDSIGRKPVLVVSKIGSVVGYLIFAFSTSYGMLLLARIVDGLSGGNISVARAYASDVTVEADRSKGMATVGIGFATGFILGPALGGVLYGVNGSFFLPGLVAAALSGVSAVLTLMFLPEASSRATTESMLTRIRALPHFFSNKAVMVLLSIQLIYMIVFSGFETSISVFMASFFHFTERHNSFVFLYLGVLALIFQGYFSRAKLVGFVKFIVVGLLLFGVSFLGISMVSQSLFLFGLLIILSVSICLVNVFLPAYFSTVVSTEKRGLALGIFESIGSISRVLGPLFIYLCWFGHLRLAYFIFGVLLVFCAAFFAITFGKIQHRAGGN